MTSVGNPSKCVTDNVNHIRLFPTQSHVKMAERDMLRRLVLGGGKVRSAVGVAQSPPVPRPPANRRGPRGLDPRQIVLLLIETLALQDLHSTTFLVYFSQFCPKVLVDVVWSLGSLEACQQV